MESNIEKELFSVTDPLGRQIRLKASTWDGHIKDKHPEKGVEFIKENILNPNLIIKNNKETTCDKERQVYLRYTPYEGKLTNQKTVVEFDEDGKGEVVTNYMLRKIAESVPEGGIVYDGLSSLRK